MKNRHYLTALTLALSSLALHAAEPLLEKTDLFEGGTGAHAAYRIPGIIVTTHGVALAYAEARSDSHADWGEIEVLQRRSTDGGKAWEPAMHIAHKGTRIEGNPHKKAGGEHEQTVNNPVAIAARDGTVHFLYCLNYARCFYMQSRDDGQTWSTPVEITATFETFRAQCPWQALATGPGHGIQLSSGRLLVPVWLAFGKVGDHSPSLTATIYSDDQGKTWHAGDIAVPNTAEFKNPNESAAVQLPDGRVLLNTRSPSAPNRRLVTSSPDGATQWSTPRFDDALWDPVCMAGFLALPKSPGTVLFSCPRNLKLDPEGKSIPGAGAPRQNLSLQLSRDSGQTWPILKTLEQPASAYSDLAVLPDGTLLCFYERGKKLTVARFNLEWLESQP